MAVTGQGQCEKLQRMNRRSFLSGIGAGLMGVVPALGQDRPVLPGEVPLYDLRPLSAVPNAQAIGRRFWMPGLNQGFVPQGLTVMDEEVLIAAYRSTDPKQDNGPAKIFRLALANGRLVGSFDLPPTYGHPGGLACSGTMLFVANSGRLLVLDMSGSAGRDAPRIVKEQLVDKAMGPSFLACHGDALWFGPFRREGQALIHAVPLARILDGAAEPINAHDATRSLPLPLRAQGATFDRSGGLWISESSGNRPAFLHRLDSTTGAVLASHPAPGGIEDLGCSRDGKLWSVSEAGSQRWSRWNTFYPLVFEIDPGKLQIEPA